MNKLNIGDYAEVHLSGTAAGSIGDGSVVKVDSIQIVQDRLLYTGTYKTDCAENAIQFGEGEYTVVKHESN